jgi:hypothetical protein
MPEIPDIDRLIAEVAARHGILLKKDDAAFALVTLNQLMLESAIRDFAAQLRAATTDFGSAIEKVQFRAGASIANSVRLALDEAQGKGTISTGRPQGQQAYSRLPGLLAAIIGAFVLGLVVGCVWQ